MVICSGCVFVRTENCWHIVLSESLFVRKSSCFQASGQLATDASIKIENRPFYSLVTEVHAAHLHMLVHPWSSSQFRCKL